MLGSRALPRHQGVLSFSGGFLSRSARLHSGGSPPARHPARRLRSRRRSDGIARQHCISGLAPCINQRCSRRIAASAGCTLGACRTYFTPARASLWDAVQGAKRAVVSLTTSALQRRNAPKARLALRVAAKKARLRRCSSLIWNDQTALLAPCRRAFLAATQARNDSDRLLG